MSQILEGKKITEYKEDQQFKDQEELIKIEKRKQVRRTRKEQEELKQLLAKTKNMDMDEAKEIYEKGQLRVGEVTKKDVKRMARLIEKADKEE